jgi:hypothetical protein
MAFGIEVVIFSLRLPALTIIEAEMFCKNSSMQGIVKKIIDIAKVTDLISPPQSHRLCGAGKIWPPNPQRGN